MMEKYGIIHYLQSKDMGIILIGSPFIMSSFVLNNQLRYQGSANYAMVAIVIGAIINIGLDPLLMFALEKGLIVFPFV